MAIRIFLTKSQLYFETQTTYAVAWEGYTKLSPGAEIRVASYSEGSSPCYELGDITKGNLDTITVITQVIVSVISP